MYLYFWCLKLGIHFKTNNLQAWVRLYPVEADIIGLLLIKINDKHTKQINLAI